MPVGYSGTPLAKKLGLKENHKICVLDAPNHYFDLFEEFPEVIVASKRDTDMDFVHFFCQESGELIGRFPELKAMIAMDGILWISWPKKASNVPTDVDGNLVRQVGLDNGLVDVKVCAVDKTWSGLKFMYRKEDRK